MRHALWSILFTALTVEAANSNAIADINVESWSVGATVYDDAASDFRTAFSTTVQNPFQATHAAIYGASSASVNNDFAWLGDIAHFDSYHTHYLQQLDGRTITGGRIHLVPAVDTNISFNGRWQFSWPGSVIGLSLLSMSVFDSVSDELVANSVAFGGNYALGPPVGTLTVQNSALLSAAGQYEINYTLRIDQDNPTPPGTHGEGSGEVHFSLTPVPEPATFALFGLALLFPRRGKPRREGPSLQ